MEGVERADGDGEQHERERADSVRRIEDPVMLVKIVVARNSAVQPGYEIPFNKPYKTRRRNTIPINLKAQRGFQETSEMEFPTSLQPSDIRLNCAA
jgi:hypothetical protein